MRRLTTNNDASTGVRVVAGQDDLRCASEVFGYAGLSPNAILFAYGRDAAQLWIDTSEKSIVADAQSRLRLQTHRCFPAGGAGFGRHRRWQARGCEPTTAL
jgi:hypothetical protein